MNRKTTSFLGAFHPILFFMVIYGISIFLSFFVCRTVYFALNGDPDQKYTEQMQKELQLSSSTYTATAAAFK